MQLIGVNHSCMFSGSFCFNWDFYGYSFSGNCEVVRALIELGAKVDVKNKDGKTPRELADEISNVTISYTT